MQVLTLNSENYIHVDLATGGGSIPVSSGSPSATPLPYPMVPPVLLPRAPLCSLSQNGMAISDPKFGACKYSHQSRRFYECHLYATYTV